MSEGNLVAKKIFERYLRGRWHRGKLGVVRWLLRAFTFASVRSHHGPILCCNPSDFTSTLALSGAYGRLLSDHIKHMQPDATFVDVGANYGLFTVLASQRLVHGHVLAFEPNPDIYSRLIYALQLNHTDNVTAMNCAVGGTSGSMKLQCSEAHSGIAKLIEDGTLPTGHSVEVPVINLAESDLFDKDRNGSVMHIKLDVEGYELEIIRALRRAPWYDRVRTLVVEIDDRYLRTYGCDAKELYTTLQDDGFTPRIGFVSKDHYDDVFSR